MTGIDVDAAKESWTGAETLLRTAFEWKYQTASRGTYPSRFGVPKKIPENRGSSAQDRTEPRFCEPNDKTGDVVKPGLMPGLRAQESQMEFPFRTLQL